MRLRFAALVLAAGSAANVAYAKRGRVRAPAAEDEAAAPRSEQEREGKEYVFAIEVVGVATPLGLGQALNVGRYLAGDELVELSAAYAGAKTTDSASTAGTTSNSYGDNARIDGHSSQVAVRYKRFVTNSFYWYAGAADRLTQAALYVVPQAGERTRIADVDAHDLGATGAIGNAWQWETLTIGCDWVGLYLKVLQVRSSYDDHGVSVTKYSSDISSARDTFKSATTAAVTAMGLRFYLGASF